MDANERRARAADKRAARDRYLQVQWPERWAEMQDRNRARRGELRQERRAQDAGRAGEEQSKWEQIDRSTAEFRQYHEPSQWALDQEVARREQNWNETRGTQFSQTNRIKYGAPLDDFRREARAAIASTRLPPVHNRPVNSKVRRQSDAAAAAFFSNARENLERDRLLRERPTLAERARQRRSADADAPPPLALMQRLAAGVGTEQERSRIAGELYEEWLFRREFPSLLAAFGARHEETVMREVHMDDVGRALTGKTPLPNKEGELLGRIEAAVIEHDLTPTQKQIFQRIRQRAYEHRADQLAQIQQHLEQAPAVQELKRRLPSIVAARRAFHEPGVRRAVEIEQAQRMRRGAAPLDIEREVARRIETAVIRHDLAPRDRETIEHLQDARALRARQGHDPSFPRPPAAEASTPPPERRVTTGPGNQNDLNLGR